MLDVLNNFFIKRFCLKNNEFFCNLCGKISPVVGPVHSEFLECQFCGVIARERVMYQALMMQYGAKANCIASTDFKDRRAVEFSPRKHPVKKKIFNSVFKEYVSCDFYGANCSYDDSINLDLSSIDSVDNFIREHGRFDVLFCSHVLEHIENYEIALHNLSRIKKSDGILLFQVPVLEKNYCIGRENEFHGDNAKVFHRFSFDIYDNLQAHFENVKIIIGLRDFEIKSHEIDSLKYNSLNGKRCYEVGIENTKLYGLGCLELLDVFLCSGSKSKEL